MAGSLGISALVCLLNNGDNGATETTQSLLGPFWRMNSPHSENGASIVRSPTPGEPLFVTGHVVDRASRPVAGAEVDVWHASPVGLYENQDPGQVDMNLRGKFKTDRCRRTAPRSAEPASLSARPSACIDLQARLQDVDLAGLRSRRSPYRDRRAVWRHQGTDGRLCPSRGAACRRSIRDDALVFARLHLHHGARRGRPATAADQVSGCAR
jgi:hypothetical protein